MMYYVLYIICNVYYTMYTVYIVLLVNACITFFAAGCVAPCMLWFGKQHRGELFVDDVRSIKGISHQTHSLHLVARNKL